MEIFTNFSRCRQVSCYKNCIVILTLGGSKQFLTLSKTKILTTRYQFMLQSWNQKTAQSLLNSLLSRS